MYCADLNCLVVISSIFLHLIVGKSPYISMLYVQGIRFTSISIPTHNCQSQLIAQRQKSASFIRKSSSYHPFFSNLPLKRHRVYSIPLRLDIPCIDHREHSNFPSVDTLAPFLVHFFYFTHLCAFGEHQLTQSFLTFFWVVAP